MQSGKGATADWIVGDREEKQPPHCLDSAETSLKSHYVSWSSAKEERQEPAKYGHRFFL